MATIYANPPRNIERLYPFTVHDKEQVIRELFHEQRYYFYDACSFRRHLHMLHPEWWFELIKRTDGVIVFTGCILMELASVSGKLEEDYIDFIKKMNEYGIHILILNEEDIFEALNVVYATNARINDFLGYAVKCVKTISGTVQHTLNENTFLKENLLVRTEVPDSDLYEKFFAAVKNNKEHADNLGEELLAICVHLLANIPDNYEHKYIILTEDKEAIGIINKAKQNSEEYLNTKKNSGSLHNKAYTTNVQ